MSRSSERLESNRPARIRRSSLGSLTSSFDRDTYVEAVKRVLEYIAAGDVFQVNLSQRFTACGRPEPLDLYLRLKAASPAPFAAFLRVGRHGRRLGKPGVVLPDAGRPVGHAADQRDPTAQPGTG